MSCWSLCQSNNQCTWFSYENVGNNYCYLFETCKKIEENKNFISSESNCQYCKGLLLFQRFRLQSKTDDVFFLIDWGRCRGDLPKIGDIVKLTNSATFLYYEFLKVGHLWYDEMNNTMLGKVYKVLERPKNTTVTLPSPNGEQNGKWYFPKSAVYCNRVALTINCPKIAPSEFSLNPH